MKVLFLGLGGVGQRHLRNFHEITGGKHEYFTVSNKKEKPEISNSLSIDTSVNIYDKYSIKVFRNLEEVFRLKPSLSFISSPSSFHYQQTKYALQNGSNVYLEKPATLTKKECEELCFISKNSNLKVSVSFQLRFMPWLNKAKEIVESEKYGRPLFISACVSEYMPGWHKYENYAESYASKKELGGGVVLTQIHEIDYLIYIFGNIYFQDSIVGKFSDLDIDVEDVAFSLLKTKFRGYELPINLRQDYLGQPKRRDLIIQFANVKMVCDFVKGNLIIQSEDKVLELFEYKNFNRNDAFISQLKNYLDNLNSNINFNTPVSLEEACKGIELAEQIKKNFNNKKL